MLFLVRLLVCVIFSGITLYAYINTHNKLTELRMRVPLAAKKAKSMKEENIRLKFEIEKYENPLNLMELARKPQYGYLKHPYVTDIITIKIPKENYETEEIDEQPNR